MIPIESYESFLNEGNRYLQIANGGLKRAAVFTPEILYNVLGMAIEKHFMALLISHGDMADNHTFTDMINSVNRVCTVDFDLASDLISLETQQNLCSVSEGYFQADPTREDIAHMINVATRVESFVLANLPKKEAIA